MNDVKQICEVTLDVPTPPLRDAQAALALARRSTRRRDALAVAGSAVAVFAAAGVIFAANATTPSQRPHTTVVAGPASSAPAALVPAPGVPSWQRAQAHGQRVANLLAAAVPAGFGSAVEFPGPGGPASTWQLERTNHYVSTTSLVISASGHEGLLEATVIRDDVPAPTGDLCSAEVSARIDHYTGVVGTCSVVTVNGEPIRVMTGNQPQLGAVTIAVRMLNGGYLAVQATQGRWHFDADTNVPPDAKHRPHATPTAPPLSGPVLSGAQVADLAANPDMLP